MYNGQLFTYLQSVGTLCFHFEIVRLHIYLLSVCLLVHPSTCPSINLSVHPFTSSSIHPSVCLSVSLLVCLSVSLSVSLSACLLFVCLTIFCPSVYLSVCLHVLLFFCLLLWTSVAVCLFYKSVSAIVCHLPSYYVSIPHCLLSSSLPSFLSFSHAFFQISSCDSTPVHSIQLRIWFTGEN